MVPLPLLPTQRSVSTPDLYDLARVAEWKPHHEHDLAHVSWVASELCSSCTPLITASEELDDLDHDLSGLSEG